jgi:glycosyltransferase involved in cell wall biosynthesis
MRIGMMADLYKPHLSGVTNYIELNKTYLEAAGHEVFVFTMGDVSYHDGEANVVRSPGLPITDTGYHLNFFYTRKAKRLLQTMDVVHVHHPFISGWLAMRYCQPRQIPIIFTNHTRYDLYAQAYVNILPGALSLGFLEAYLPAFCAAADMVVSPSQGMADVLRRLKVDAPIEVIPNGVDIQRFIHVKAPLDRADLGFAHDDILLIYAGRVAPEKNLALLIQAFNGVAEAVPNAHLLILGSGPSLEEVQKLATGSPAAANIHFLGRVSYDQVPPYLAMCDAFVTPSVSEVHPLSVIESMAAGLPILGIHSPGVSDTVEDGVTGYLSSNDVAAFTAKLTRLCVEPRRRRKLANAARQASYRYDIKHTGPEMLGHYERLAAAPRPRRRSAAESLNAVLERFLS